jgi:dCMP deaminase
MNEQYWLNICRAVGANSKCLSRKIGAVIVKDNYIISTGYNGPPIKCKHCDDYYYRRLIFALAHSDGVRFDSTTDDNTICPRRIMGFESGQGMAYCSAAHAERNAISTAAKLGHSTEGTTMYLDWIIPCFECAKSIINAGIKTVVVVKLEDYEKEGITGRYLLEQAGVKLREYDFEG